MSTPSPDFSQLTTLFPEEIITQATVEDVELNSPWGGYLGNFALIRLDNGESKRPNTLGPATLIALGEVLDAQKKRAIAGDIIGVGIIGNTTGFAAGADLTAAAKFTTEEQGILLAQLGHATFHKLRDMGAPSFVFINGLALGGGLELPLNANYRTVSTTAKPLGLPEVFLGLIPGWGGTFILPRLIGPEAAVEVMLKNPLNNNRTLSGEQAADLGIADALIDAEDFETGSLAWAAAVLSGELTLEQAPTDTVSPEDAAAWDQAVTTAQQLVDAKADTSQSAQKLVDLLQGGKNWNVEQGFAAEDEALGELLQSDQFRATRYAFFDLLQRRAKNPAGAPDTSLARTIGKVGVVGAGLMASQLAMLFASQLQVPVTMVDLDQERVDKGLAWIRAELEKLVSKGRMKQEAAQHIASLVSGSVEYAAFADADLVIEAVFEELEVKKKVFAQLEQVVSTDCVLATNTSSLSVTAMGENLANPERLVGIHFFNPVAAMPLVEIVRTEQTSDPTLATAFALVKGLKKTAVLVQDATGFVVNRILLRLMGEVARAFDNGTDAAVADNSLKPLGLPMTPFHLLAMVGIPVAQHVSESLHTSFGDRFWVSPNQQRLIDAGKKTLWEKGPDGREVIPADTMALLKFGDQPVSSEDLLLTVQNALAEEIGLMLSEGVVAEPEDIDLCMILGAGWPLRIGGITPYLDRTGAAERVNGKRFHAPGVASVA